MTLSPDFSRYRFPPLLPLTSSLLCLLNVGIELASETSVWDVPHAKTSVSCHFLPDVSTARGRSPSSESSGEFLCLEVMVRECQYALLGIDYDPMEFSRAS